MIKIGIIVLLVQAILFFQGCAPLEYLDGSSKNEIDTFKTSKSEMRSEAAELRSENKALQRQIDVLAVLEREHRKLIDENEQKIAEIRDQNKLLQEKLRRREAENQQLRDEVELVKLRDKNALSTVKNEKELLSSKLSRREEESRLLGEENSLLQEKLRRREAENQRLRDELEFAKEELKGKNELARARISEKSALARMRNENELLSGKISEFEAENQRLRDEVELVKLRDKNELATMKDEVQLLRDKLTRQEAENQRLRDEAELAKAQLKDKNELVRVKISEQNELARIRDENELLKKQVKNIISENQRIKYENMALVKVLARREEEEKAAAAKTEMIRRELQKLNIKVLSRDSRDFAERMAEKLRKMGYSINSVGYAPRSQFLPNTVYFAFEFKEEAEQLVASLGGDARFEPLKLPSVFDLIIVTGKEE
jgi:chromosome segregation ATPase